MFKNKIKMILDGLGLIGAKYRRSRDLEESLQPIDEITTLHYFLSAKLVSSGPAAVCALGYTAGGGFSVALRCVRAAGLVF